MSDTTTTSAEQPFFDDPAWLDELATEEMIDAQADSLPDHPLDCCPFCGSDSCDWNCAASREQPEQPPEPPQPKPIPEGVINECRNMMAALDHYEWPEDDVYSIAPGYDFYAYTEKGQRKAFVCPMGRTDLSVVLR